MDVGLLRDMIYLNILFGLSNLYDVEMNFKIVTPFFLVSMDFNKTEVAFFLSVSTLTNIAARQFGVAFLFFLVENKKQPSKQWLTADCVNASSTSCRKRSPPTRSPVIGFCS
ncbi:hypothetical protein pipiens_008394 [Culex pipiens pipiens]|uniref:Uncharacterized protein n=1 Tax=Culex pipiens pipiens TaxID=38569 RepID=A0ABD1DI03_CULPP